MYDQLMSFFWMIKLYQIWPVIALSRWLLCPLTLFPLVAKYHLAFWHKIPQTHRFFPDLDLELVISPRNASSLLGNSIGVMYLIATRVSLFLAHLNAQSLGNFVFKLLEFIYFLWVVKLLIEYVLRFICFFLY